MSIDSTTRTALPNEGLALSDSRQSHARDGLAPGQVLDAVALGIDQALRGAGSVEAVDTGSISDETIIVARAALQQEEVIDGGAFRFWAQTSKVAPMLPTQLTEAFAVERKLTHERLLELLRLGGMDDLAAQAVLHQYLRAERGQRNGDPERLGYGGTLFESVLRRADSVKLTWDE